MLAHRLQAQSHHHPISNQLKLLSFTRITLKYLSHRRSSALLWLGSGTISKCPPFGWGALMTVCGPKQGGGDARFEKQALE